MSSFGVMHVNICYMLYVNTSMGFLVCVPVHSLVAGPGRILPVLSIVSWARWSIAQTFALVTNRMLVTQEGSRPSGGEAPVSPSCATWGAWCCALMCLFWLMIRIYYSDGVTLARESHDAVPTYPSQKLLCYLPRCHVETWLWNLPRHTRDDTKSSYASL